MVSPLVLRALGAQGIVPADGESSESIAWRLAVRTMGRRHPADGEERVERAASKALALALLRGDAERAEYVALGALDPSAAMERGLLDLGRVTS